MKFKVGDIIKPIFTDDRKVSWRGTVRFVGPMKTPPYSNDNPALDNEDSYWILWDNGNSNRVNSSRIEFDKEYLRNNKLNELGI